MAGEKEIGSFFGQDGIVYEERARKDLPIPGWRLHMIKSKIKVSEPIDRWCRNEHPPGWCLDMVIARVEEVVYSISLTDLAK
jgi:hypothetical protein